MLCRELYSAGIVIVIVVVARGISISVVVRHTAEVEAEQSRAEAERTASTLQTDNITSMPSCLDPVLPCTVCLSKQYQELYRQEGSYREGVGVGGRVGVVTHSMSVRHSRTPRWVEDADGTTIVVLMPRQGDKQCSAFCATNVTRTVSQHTIYLHICADQTSVAA